MNFERETLEEGLRHVGFYAEKPAFYSWLGVTPYLVPETVLATLRLIIGLCGENGVAFDYAVPRASLPLLTRVAFDALAARVAAAGEPFRGFFVPEELGAALQGMEARNERRRAKEGLVQFNSCKCYA